MSDLSDLRGVILVLEIRLYVQVLQQSVFVPKITGTFNTSRIGSNLSLLTPFVLLSDLCFLLGCKIIDNVKSLSNLLWCLTLDH